MPTVKTVLYDSRLATPRSVAALRRGITDLAARAGAAERDRQDIALAVSEALANVVAHAYPGERFPGTVVVHAAFDDGALEVVITDAGVGMPRPTCRPAAGLGLGIIARATDRLELSDAAPGTRVRMRFRLG